MRRARTLAAEAALNLFGRKTMNGMQGTVTDAARIQP